MASLQGTQAEFDPLSGAGDDGAFTTVFESSPAAAAPPPPPPPAHTDATAASGGSDGGGGGGAPNSEYDSFMTARSNVSYMTASHTSTGGGGGGGTAAAAAPSGGMFKRLPDRPAPSFTTEPAAAVAAVGGDGYSNPFGGAAAAADTSNPFGAAAPASPPPPPPAAVAQSTQHDLMGPLSFGGGGGGGYSQQPQQPATNTNFMMPLDLYDTPDAAVAASSQQLQQQQLPPLYNFTREFSTALPLSEDPTSPYGGDGGGRGGGGPAAAAQGGGSSSSYFVGGGGGGGATAGGGTSVMAAYDNPFAPGPSGGGGGGSGAAAGYGAGPSGSGSAAAAGGGGGGHPADGYRFSSSGGGGYRFSSAGGGGVSSPTSYAAAALMTNTVSVHSPRKVVVPSRIPGLSEPYILFKVASRGAAVGEAVVERRFRDVVALAEALTALYPGCFLPPRPSRAAIEGRRMLPAFVEERRLGIEKFLRRLVVHPVMGPSEVTQVWLRSQSADLRTCPEWLRLQPSAPPGLARSTARLMMQVVGRERTVPSPVEVTRPASERGDVYRLMHERAAQMRGVMQKSQPTPTEEKLREEAAGMQERSELLVTLSRRADHLVARASKCASVLTDLAAALGGGAEADEAAAAAAGLGAWGGTPAAALRAAAEGSGKVGKLYGVATDASAKHLTPLHDWLAAAPGAAVALAARERALLTVATLEADEAAARARLAEAEARAGGGAGGPAAVKKAEALRLQVSQLAAAGGAARDEYERVAQRNTAELAAFKAHMSRELADSVREFALVQVAAAQKAHAMWQEAAAALVSLAANSAATAAAAAAMGGGGGGRSGRGAAVY